MEWRAVEKRWVRWAMGICRNTYRESQPAPGWEQTLPGRDGMRWESWCADGWVVQVELMDIGAEINPGISGLSLHQVLGAGIKSRPAWALQALLW